MNHKIALKTSSLIELNQAFANIPAGTTALDLSLHSLGTIAAAELAQAFAIIPASVTSLNLGSNLLYIKNGAELAQAFARIPTSVTSLDLRWNVLDRTISVELANAFAGMPAGITMITLSEEEIVTRSEEELIALGSALPHMMKIQVVNTKGEPIANESVNILRQHIGGGIKEAYQRLSSVLGPDVVNIIFEKSTGFEANEIYSFFHQPRPELQISTCSSSSSSSTCGASSSSSSYQQRQRRLPTLAHKTLLAAENKGPQFWQGETLNDATTIYRYKAS